ncbi:hypothetical protein [Thalassomonas sp. M1454]|uniref:hypothetical protein n=1 Tax=Thalassomonas sp. M1454 TaxID=2594477 RepID=UPI001181479C|nr:hypothetical protein [Thalassomonas sp. M1454]TRX54982.1 hypothetical protein FNN08_10280 [Thalassomonas sp. M1454]
MKVLPILLVFTLCSCAASFQPRPEANVAPELPKHLDEDNYKHNDDDGMVLVAGNCKELQNNEYCDDLKRKKADDQKQLDESLKKHVKQ